ncbi:MAG TPA: hypothetical protein VMU94_30305 [Streptosporangiaceae bacterium]|nr:hypothetical protein [Streptosporangiaceae bacterium]
MTDLAQGQAASAGIAVPSPLSIRPRVRCATADSGRAMARAVLDDALSGVELTAVDRRFLSRLSQWDKRNATTVASLIARARQAGRCEALTGEQLETVLCALIDAFAYRTSGAAPEGCWDCANRASGLCAEHAKDADRAHAFAELAAVLSGAATRPTLPGHDAVAGFRHQAAVAS